MMHNQCNFIRTFKLAVKKLLVIMPQIKTGKRVLYTNKGYCYCPIAMMMSKMSLIEKATLRRRKQQSSVRFFALFLSKTDC